VQQQVRDEQVLARQALAIGQRDDACGELREMRGCIKRQEIKARSRDTR
jgi:hypothetical protein